MAPSVGNAEQEISEAIHKSLGTPALSELIVMIKRDPLEKCLTKSLCMNDLEFEHPSTVHEISKTILAIDENEHTVVIEEKKDTRWFGT